MIVCKYCNEFGLINVRKPNFKSNLWIWFYKRRKVIILKAKNKKNHLTKCDERFEQFFSKINITVIYLFGFRYGTVTGTYARMHAAIRK